ncbi:MAG TPA: DDE transposase family protein [Coleofasciculaceae cyanobacterium]
MMTDPEAWYIVKQPDGHCEVIPGNLVQDEIIPNEGMPSNIPPSSSSDAIAENPPKKERWGPFASQGEAIARRVGLIRSGKCQPL